MDDADDERFILRFGSWEGPIEALLDLARTQKVDLALIDVTSLVDQFESVVAKAMALRLELAADWLVMASWLAYLKSRTLLRRPKEKGAEITDDDEDALASYLKRLEAVRAAAAWLGERPSLGRDWFPAAARDCGTGVIGVGEMGLDALIAAYPKPTSASPRERPVELKPFDLASVDSALARLARSLPGEWTDLLGLVPKSEGLRLRSEIATSLVASLELSRDGRADIRQDGQFGRIEVKASGGRHGD